MNLIALLDQLRPNYSRKEMMAAINKELSEHGVVTGLDDLRSRPEELAEAVPVLVKLLPTFADFSARIAITHEMWHTDVDPEVYLKEYRSLAPIVKGDPGAQSYAESLANILSDIAEAKHVDEILRLAQDETYGFAAMILIDIFPRFKRRQADFIPFLMQLLNHPTNGRFAIQTLGKLKAQEAIPGIMQFVEHPEWAADATTALRKLGVNIGGKADLEAIASYQERFQAIEQLGTPLLTFHDGVDELRQFFAEITALVQLKGFTPTEANNVVCYIRDHMTWGDDDHDTAGLAFDIRFNDAPGLLAFEIWMAETDIADISIMMPETLFPAIKRIMDDMYEAMDAEE